MALHGINSLLPSEILMHIFKDVHKQVLTNVFKNLHPQQGQLLDGSDSSDRTDSEDESDKTDMESSSASARSEGCEVDVEKLCVAVQDPSFFPYNLASVCDCWKDILSSTPEFWTTVVLFLDAESTPLETAQRYFKWSRELPIDVFMTRRQEFCMSPEVAEIMDGWMVTGERETVHQNMQALIPNFDRCRTLHIDVTINTALPIFLSYLSNKTPLL